MLTEARNNHAAVAAQVREAVKIELYLALDQISIDATNSGARIVARRLQDCLSQYDVSFTASRSALSSARARVRRDMLTEINSVSLDLLQMARSGFAALAGAGVSFLINTAAPRQKPDFVAFDFRDFPFVNFHGDALVAALKIREKPSGMQFHAFRYAFHRWELDLLELSLGVSGAIPGDLALTLEKRSRVKHLLDEEKERLSRDAVRLVDEFYHSIEVGSFFAYALPIAICPKISHGDLLSVADALWGFGDTLRIPFILRFTGPAEQVEAASNARDLYESAGIAFKALSAWLKAIESIRDSKQCSLCYRHASAISRCSVHATKTKETPETRLGQRISPHYRDRLDQYHRVPELKRMLSRGLPSSTRPNIEMVIAAANTGLSAAFRRKALVLAVQLSHLVGVMSVDMRSAAGLLFNEILAIASQWETRNGESALGRRELQRNTLVELLSLKGFFRAWCGVGHYSPYLTLRMRGFDRDHPVVHGISITGADVSRMLIKQRAWEEATAEFEKRYSVSVRSILELLTSGLSKRQAAAELRIGQSTLYKILGQQPNARRRQYLGSSHSRATST